MKTGWVLQDRDDEFVTEDFDTSECISEAEVHATRKLAANAMTYLSDVVRKVEVDENGIAVEIIPGR